MKRNLLKKGLIINLLITITLLVGCNLEVPTTASEPSEPTNIEENYCSICHETKFADVQIYDELTPHTPTTFDENSVITSSKEICQGVVQNTYDFTLNSGKKSRVVITEVDLNYASIEGGTYNNKTSFSTLSTVVSQAQAFEEDNPNYTVIAAINADFFGNGKSVNAFVKESIIIKDGHNDNGSYDYTNINADIPASMPMLFGVSGNAAQVNPIIKNAPVKDTVKSKLFYELLLERDKNHQVLTTNVVLNVYGGDKDNVNIIYKTGRDGTATPDSTVLKMKKHNANSTRIHGEIIGIETVDKTTKYRSTAEEYYIMIPNSLGITDLQIGDIISNHVNSSDNTWKYYDTIIGCRQALVIDGKIASTVTLENTNGAQSTGIPRTAIGVMPNGKVAIFSVEGLRYGKTSSNDDDPYGLSLPQLADFMRYYGVYSGANFDGGGSTQLLTRNLETKEFDVTVRSSDYGTTIPTASRHVINSLLVYVELNQSRE